MMHADVWTRVCRRNRRAKMSREFDRPSINRRQLYVDVCVFVHSSSCRDCVWRDRRSRKTCRIWSEPKRVHSTLRRTETRVFSCRRIRSTPALRTRDTQWLRVGTLERNPALFTIGVASNYIRTDTAGRVRSKGAVRAVSFPGWRDSISYSKSNHRFTPDRQSWRMCRACSTNRFVWFNPTIRCKCRCGQPKMNKNEDALKSRFLLKKKKKRMVVKSGIACQPVCFFSCFWFDKKSWPRFILLFFCCLVNET